VFLALRDAIGAASTDPHWLPPLQAPATGEAILTALAAAPASAPDHYASAARAAATL